MLRSISCAVLFVFFCLSFGQAVDPQLFSGLVWRSVGPFRAGRVAAVSGVIGQPGTFYMGMPGGGVWKTTSAGVTWTPIFDDIKTCSSVGAIEVAPSDPNVVYVGMGDMRAGGAINEGNGVYKSTDAGKTWQHMGLDESKQIPSILVDPHDPNLVMVAAQGSIFKKSEDRGLYRSTDGGKTWIKTLYVDDQTGIQKIAWAYDNPRVMLATTVHHFTDPTAQGGRGGGGFGGGGQPGTTKLFKSTDEGLTWTELSGGGLPALAGRTCVAIAMGTNSQRMFLVQNSGLYRSDDGGTNWRQMDAEDRRVANGQGGYNCGVYVDSKNPDIVYVVNTCSYRSLDGGKTFTGFKGAPGGDDPQQIWIDPTDGNRMLFGMDQGATITFDGGLTWSLWYNQPTAQVYHISVDNQFPYWIYATQQDTGSVMTSSRGNYGAVTSMDWSPHPGYEFGSIVADPLNPKISYAGGPSGGIVRVTNPSGQWIDVSPNLDSAEGLRKVGNQPVAFSQKNPKELLAGFQCLMSTTDGGKTWKKISPDLGYPKGVTPPKPGVAPARPAGGGTVIEDEDEDQESEAASMAQGGPGQGGVIESFSTSTIDNGIIWVGTNNGLVKVTKDHGKTWNDVTIPGLSNPTRADISAIDASHHDPAAAYVAIDYHNIGDYKPYIFRTHDFGKTWTKVTDGLPENLISGSFARVVRADSKKAGLLFAGTESAVYVSFDDGDNWQSLGLNAPITSYRDMVVKDNDLVVGTYGRSFWILDDLSPLRQVSAMEALEPAILFKPADAIRLRRNVNADTPFPPEVPHALNPPVGAIVYYYLRSQPKGTITLDVTDSRGNPVCHMSSAPIATLKEPPPPVPDFWLERPSPMPDKPGMWRINWNLRYDNPPAFNHSYEINANPGETPASPEGPLVLPGVYTLTLTVDGKQYKQTVNVRNDPRSPATISELTAQHELQMRLYEAVRKSWDGFQAVSSMRAQVSEILDSNPAEELSKAAKEFESKLNGVAGSSGGRRFGGGGPGAGGSPSTPTFTSVHSAMIRHLDTLESGDMAPNEPLRKACAKAFENHNAVNVSWTVLNQKDLAAFNAVLAKFNHKPIAAMLLANGPR